MNAKKRIIFKFAIIWVIFGALCLVALPLKSYAAELKITKIGMLSEEEDAYELSKYNEVENIMRVKKYDRTLERYVYGYADRELNIIIPFNQEWQNAGDFLDGHAIVEHTEVQCRALIDKNGNIKFFFGALGDTGVTYGLIKQNDDGKVAYRLVDNGSRYYGGDPSVYIYDMQGKYETLSLAEYDFVGSFLNGYANVYKVINSGHHTYHTNGSEGAKIPWVEYDCVGSVDYFGNFSAKKQGLDTVSSNNRLQINDKYHFAKDILTDSADLVIVDVNGNMCSEQRFVSVSHIFGNRVIAKSRTDVDEYFKNATEDERAIAAIFNDWVSPVRSAIYEIEIN